MANREPVTLGDRLRRAREEAGLSQVELAERAKMKQSDVSKLETSKSLETAAIARLGVALGVDPIWLESGEGEAPLWLLGGKHPPRLPAAVNVHPKRALVINQIVQWCNAMDADDLLRLHQAAHASYASLIDPAPIEAHAPHPSSPP